MWIWVDKKLNHSTGGWKKYDIVNCGHDGFTIQGVKRMLEHDCILRQPDIVSLLIGCNDVGVVMNTGKVWKNRNLKQAMNPF